MATSSSIPLVLGFIGDQTVHRDNSIALIDDLVVAHRKTQKGAKVRFLLSVEPFTDTMSDLADHCLTKNYGLELIGHIDALEGKAVQPFIDHAEVIEMGDGESTAAGMVNRLTSSPATPRLILISDSMEDDNAYIALWAATGKNIPVRSMLHGLDIVILDTKTEETPPMRIVEDLDETEGEEGAEVEEELDYDEEEPDEEDLEDEDDPEDDDEVEVETEDEDEDEDEEAGDGVVDGEVEEDDDDDQDGDEEEEDEDPVDGEDADLDEEEPDDETEEEEMPVTKTKTKSSSNGEVKWTESKLLWLASKDKEEFHQVAAEFGVYPGRGLKLPILVARVLDAQDGNPPLKAKKPAVKPAKPVKKVARGVTKRRVAVADVSAKRVAKPVTNPGRPRTTTAAPVASTNGHVSNAARRTLIKLAKATIDVLEEIG